MTQNVEISYTMDHFSNGLLTPRKTVMSVVRRVSNESGVSVADIIGPRRFGGMVRARQLVMHRAKQEGFSLTQIGRALGGRDHTTVMHGQQRVQARIDAGEGLL